MKKVMKGIGTAMSLGVGLVASVILIVMGLVYFIIALWIVKFGAGILGYTLDGNWAVLSASLISVGSMIGSAVKK
ncbi:hypothetical protein KY360_07490 [Candidatus Woesearchaeota archaeon]|nr:hypothetical protein [Candidatus Woesearchaeota archaeon]